MTNLSIINAKYNPSKKKNSNSFSHLSVELYRGMISNKPTKSRNLKRGIFFFILNGFILGDLAHFNFKF